MLLQSHSLCKLHVGQYQAGVTKRWELLSQAQSTVKWPALSIRQVESPQTWHLFVQLFFKNLLLQCKCCGFPSMIKDNEINCFFGVSYTSDSARRVYWLLHPRLPQIWWKVSLFLDTSTQNWIVTSLASYLVHGKTFKRLVTRCSG